MKPRKVTFVHGINTKRDYPIREKWGPLLPWDDLIIDVAWWPSTGSVFGDVARISASSSFHDECLHEVSEGIHNPDLIIAHSMGTVWIIELFIEDPSRFENTEIVLVGSPCSHFILRNLLRVRGVLSHEPLKEAGRVFTHLFNRDDQVCALSQWASHPFYTRPVPVAIGGRGFEHPMEDYLPAPATHKELLSLRGGEWTSC